MAQTTNCPFLSAGNWSVDIGHDLEFSDYRINESKLRPRLAAMFCVNEGELKCTWTNGTYVVKGVPASGIDQVSRQTSMTTMN